MSDTNANTESAAAVPAPAAITTAPSPQTEAERAAAYRTTYPANCHCGTVKYTVTIPHPFPIYPIQECSCTVCVKNGYRMVFPPRKDVVWISGYENLKDYFFGPMKKAHKFCQTCGSSVMIDFLRESGDTRGDVVAMNTRMFKDIDFNDMKMNWSFYDGKTLPSV